VDLQDTQGRYQDKPISISRSLEPGAFDIDIGHYQF
jgi:hypothetical protein